MKTLAAAAVLAPAVFAVATLGGCATQPTQATIDQPMPEHLALAMHSSQPTFGVGDELGWLAFGDLALAPARPRRVHAGLVVSADRPPGDRP